MQVEVLFFSLYSQDFLSTHVVHAQKPKPKPGHFMLCLNSSVVSELCSQTENLLELCHRGLLLFSEGTKLFFTWAPSPPLSYALALTAFLHNHHFAKYREHLDHRSSVTSLQTS